MSVLDAQAFLRPAVARVPAVDAALIRLEELKRQKAEARLAQLMDPEMLAGLDAAEQAARRDLDEAEARAAAAQLAWHQARGAVRDRQERVKVMRAEVARAQAAIHSAERAHARESAQRDELIPA